MKLKSRIANDNRVKGNYQCSVLQSCVFFNAIDAARWGGFQLSVRLEQSLRSMFEIGRDWKKIECIKGSIPVRATRVDNVNCFTIVGFLKVIMSYSKRREWLTLDWSRFEELILVWGTTRSERKTETELDSSSVIDWTRVIWHPPLISRSRSTEQRASVKEKKKS